MNLAVIRVRAGVGIHPDVKATLDSLKLQRKNGCVIVPDTSAFRGMLKRVKDFVTYGTLDKETEDLLRKRKHTEGKIPFFTLAPPRKGFGRKGIKLAFVKGGALGERKEKINDLVRRMLPQ